MKKFLNDLISIEVNTIITSKVSGANMPEIPFALYDIAKDFLNKLRSFHKTIKPTIVPCTNCDEILLYLSYSTNDPVISLSSELFSDANKCAKQLMAENRPELDKALLERIRYMSGQIAALLKKHGMTHQSFQDQLASRKSFKEILDGYAAIDFDPEEMSLICKAWQLEVDDIAMQTVVQISGDIVNRVRPKYCNETFKLVHMLHAQCVQNAVGYWQTLIQTLASFVARIFRRTP